MNLSDLNKVNQFLSTVLSLGGVTFPNWPSDTDDADEVFASCDVASVFLFLLKGWIVILSPLLWSFLHSSLNVSVICCCCFS